MYPRCPVCGFNEMPYAPVPFNVCPCCGTEFGVDDRKTDHETLQRSWAANGYPWFDDITFPSASWNPRLQVALLNLIMIDRQVSVVADSSATQQETAFAIRPIWTRRQVLSSGQAMIAA